MTDSVNKVSKVSAPVAPVTVIRPLKGWVPINLRELWAYRELLYFFTWRDIKVRYKQALLGFAWAVIQPFFTMIIFSLFFGTLAKVPSEGIPYPLFSYAALLPWTLFANGVTRASNSLVQDANLVQKVYFPRLLMPLSSILSPLVDFAIAFVVLFGLMLYFGYYPHVTMLWILVFLLLELMLALGVGLWLSAINVEYRDVSNAVPFLIGLLLFASPVIYSSTFVPERFQAAYGLINPMSGIIEGFRWAILGTKPPSYLIFASVAIIIVVLISGAFYFRRREKSFADVV
ncbi:MAG TPA: ABC transporter permease [Dehalococcoidia bacterium]